MMTNWHSDFDVFKTKFHSPCGLPHPSNCQLHPGILAQIKSLEGISDFFLVLTSVIQSNRKSYLGLPLRYIPNLTTAEHLLLTVLFHVTNFCHLGFWCLFVSSPAALAIPFPQGEKVIEHSSHGLKRQRTKHFLWDTFPRTSSWLIPSAPSGICLKVSFSGRPSLGMLAAAPPITSACFVLFPENTSACDLLPLVSSVSHC